VPSSPEVRPLRESELDELIDLLCLVHNPRGHDRYRDYIQGDPTWQPSNTPVIAVDGRLVSTLRIWDRWLHLGSTPVRMGGIGGVTTHPDYRRRGLASQLMRSTGESMAGDGYDVGLLFTEIPARFYRRLGWCSVPTLGFQLTLRSGQPASEGLPDVVSFEETRDLEDAVALYRVCNDGCSGTMLRPRAYWDYAPSRVRGVLPTVVVRDGSELLGYLNFELSTEEAWVDEVAGAEPAASAALVRHLRAECDAAGVTRVRGDIPYKHPFVDALATAADADLQPTGYGAMMALPLHRDALVDKVAPAAPAAVGDLPADLLCRLLFGEMGGDEVGPVLSARGLSLDGCDELAARFPRRQVVFWGNDHF
jgi:GNAT superfamily N-acetyltransferase